MNTQSCTNIQHLVTSVGQSLCNPFVGTICQSPWGLGCVFPDFQELKSFPVFPTGKLYCIENHGQKLKRTIMQTILPQYLIHISAEVSCSPTDRARLQLHQHLQIITDQKCCGRNSLTAPPLSIPLLSSSLAACAVPKPSQKARSQPDQGLELPPYDCTNIWGQR